jgi:hypothetical protein
MPLTGLEGGVGCACWPCWLWSCRAGFTGLMDGSAAGVACRAAAQHPIVAQLQLQGEEVLDGPEGGAAADDAGRGDQHTVELAQIQEQGEHAADGPPIPQLADKRR